MDPQERKIKIRSGLRVGCVVTVAVLAVAFAAYLALVAAGRLPLLRRSLQPTPAPAVQAVSVPTEEPMPTEEMAATEEPAATAEPEVEENTEPVEETIPPEEPTSEPISEPTPEPAPELTPEPVSDPTEESTGENSEEPTEEPAEPMPAPGGKKEKQRCPSPDLQSIGEQYWYLQLANRDWPLAEDYAPEELVHIENGQYVDRRIEAPLRQLFAAAREAGYSLYFCSGYRDYDTQSSIYWNHIDEYQAQGLSFEEADALTCLSVQRPGCSEHQLGLTADVLEYAEQDMLPYIGGSGLMAWLEKNCARYGFIIRYPEGKTEITGVDYEPWHLRYVGTAAARYITDNGLCLEEFLALCAEQTDPVTEIEARIRALRGEAE